MNKGSDKMNSKKILTPYFVVSCIIVSSVLSANPSRVSASPWSRLAASIRGLSSSVSRLFSRSSSTSASLVSQARGLSSEGEPVVLAYRSESQGVDTRATNISDLVDKSRVKALQKDINRCESRLTSVEKSLSRFVIPSKDLDEALRHVDLDNPTNQVIAEFSYMDMQDQKVLQAQKEYLQGKLSASRESLNSLLN